MVATARPSRSAMRRVWCPGELPSTVGVLRTLSTAPRRGRFPGPHEADARYARPSMTTTSPSSPETPAFRYNAALANRIEAKWQDRWDVEHTFWTPNPTGALADGFDEVADRRKLYVLDMFPYPSGTGLHVGHPLGYIGT